MCPSEEIVMDSEDENNVVIELLPTTSSSPSQPSGGDSLAFFIPDLNKNGGFIFIPSLIVVCL